jgi:hypothetical protein
MRAVIMMTDMRDFTGLSDFSSPSSSLKGNLKPICTSAKTPKSRAR